MYCSLSMILYILTLHEERCALYSYISITNFQFQNLCRSSYIDKKIMQNTHTVHHLHVILCRSILLFYIDLCEWVGEDEPGIRTNVWIIILRTDFVETDSLGMSTILNLYMSAVGSLFPVRLGYLTICSVYTTAGKPKNIQYIIIIIIIYKRCRLFEWGWWWRHTSPSLLTIWFTTVVSMFCV